jgi:hypothetical protein
MSSILGKVNDPSAAPHSKKPAHYTSSNGGWPFSKAFHCYDNNTTSNSSQNTNNRAAEHETREANNVGLDDLCSCLFCSSAYLT